MAKFVKRKNIIIKSAGTLHLLGGITGPILTPFPCDVDTILQLLITHNEVYEVTKDGRHIKLDRKNYNKEIDAEPKRPLVKEEPVLVSVQDETVVLDTETTTTKSEQIKEFKNNKNRNDKKIKNNK